MVNFGKPQKQEGVNMVRIKLPFGKVTTQQLLAIGNVAEKFTNSNLHTTTRQDIQLHYVRFADIEPLWSTLEAAGLLQRETFGNTLRNITASPLAGIDANEAFDVTPYVKAVISYFNGHESCNDMGRKVKMAFSSNKNDAAYTFMNDIGFVPVIEDGLRGFKVKLGGGMAGQIMMAQTAVEFLAEDSLIPYLESILRVFSQYGERLNRSKSRLKFLVQSLGFDSFLSLVEQEFKLLNTKYVIDVSETIDIPNIQIRKENPVHKDKYNQWLDTNVVKQKQSGFYAVNLKLKLGNILSEKVRQLTSAIDGLASSELKITSNQGIQLSFVHEQNLPALFNALFEIGLAEPGFNSTLDITACPGTDTCNLGITNSTKLALELETYLEHNFSDLVYDKNVKIKISGCINSCGHHTVANIGLQGTTLRHNDTIIPAMKIMLGGGVDQFGKGSVAQKVATIPTKRTLEAIGLILDDFESKAEENEFFNNYFQRKTELYFGDLLKSVCDLSTLKEGEQRDWGEVVDYEKPVPRQRVKSTDLIQDLMTESTIRFEKAVVLINEGHFNDAVIHVYNAYVRIAKAMLLHVSIECGTQISLLTTFDEQFVADNKLSLSLPALKEYVLSYKTIEINKEFAKEYLQTAQLFHKECNNYLEN